MDIGIIAKRYAKALFAFASENHDEQTVYQAMLNLVNSYQKVEQLHPTLLNPVLTPEKQKAILLASSVGDGESVPVSLSRFVQLVVSHKRIEIMPFIAQSYIQIYRKSQKMFSGRLIVPYLRMRNVKSLTTFGQKVDGLHLHLRTRLMRISLST